MKSQAWTKARGYIGLGLRVMTCELGAEITPIQCEKSEPLGGHSGVGSGKLRDVER